ncbi:MAG: HAMP domain-containing sensor histidine kinase [Ginsengibacter sp.]
MKLLSKYNRVNVVATIIVVLLSAVLYYFFIEAALIHQLDKNLAGEEKEITDYIKENNQLPEPSNTKDEQDVYTKITGQSISRKFRSIDLFHEGHHEYISYRQLEFPATVANNTYKVDVRKSQEETEDLIQLVLKITLAVVIILMVTLFIINRFVLSKLWKPFDSTLQQVKQFNLSGKNEVLPEKTDIDEFAELNAAVIIMTKRASRDYNEIKSLTENASHEIQTPLAIIQSKLELLSQSENLNEEQMNTIQSISETTNRLSKLNQSLILLTKIDNQQFRENEKVNISALLLRHLNNYEELFHAKQITVTKIIQPAIELIINETLAEILIINLLTNAIKHNVDKGSVTIELHSKFLSVTNTGSEPGADPSIFFERFKKESLSNDSLGLGLSIVKKIGDTYGFGVEYVYAKNFHTLTVNF